MKKITSGKISIKSLIITVVFLFLLTSSASKADTLESVNFFVDPSYDSSGRANITATNRINGTYAHFYFEDAYWAKLSPNDQNALISSANALSDEFSNTIYPKTREIYDKEWNPGIDNDPKIYILLTDIIKDAGGYYNPNDEYPKDQVKDSRSNEKELIYLNANFIARPNMKSYLAHEFQHMINWYQKKKLLGVDEEVWLNEGLSEYAATALGYDNIYDGSNLESRSKNFLHNPSDSLTEWKNLNQDYSSINLFMQFLVDHYGKGVLKTIINSPKIGTAAIDDALRQIDPKVNFTSVFADWTIANYLNNLNYLNGKFAYLNPNLNYSQFHVSPTSSYLIYANIKAQEEEITGDWSGKWYEFDSSQTLSAPNQSLKIDFSADDPNSKFMVPYVIKNRDGTINYNFLTLDSRSKSVTYIENFGTKVRSVAIMPISQQKLTDFTNAEPAIKFYFTASLAQSTGPVVNDITPRTATVDGGTIITITGENFDSNSNVRIGGSSAAIISISSSKTIIAKIPPALRSGDVKVEVTNSNSLSAVAPQTFTYLPQVADGSLIRAEGDYKVYVVSGKYKRWIQSAKIFKFYPHFGWTSVVVVSPTVRDSYQTSSLIRADGDYNVYEVQTNNVKRNLKMSAEKFTASGRFWDSIFIINKAERNFYKTGIPITN